MPINSFLYPGAKFTPPYSVANSCRFNAGSSDYLSKTYSSDGNQKTWTFSAWLKRSYLGTTGTLIFSFQDPSGDARSDISFAADKLYVSWNPTGSSWYYADTSPSRFFRDVSGWYHLVVACDTTQSTDTNRLKIYINGEQLGSDTIDTYPSQDQDTGFNKTGYVHEIGRYAHASSNTWDGYMCEVVMIDGQQLAPTSFGEFDEDSPTIWKPKSVSGLTFGTNGFHLDFKDSSALGNDVSGNNHDFAANNLTSIDQSTDTCTNNFCTLNPLDGGNSGTFTEGNLKLVTANSGYATTRGTFGVSTGKWYFEGKLISGNAEIGIITSDQDINDSDDPLGKSTNGYAYTNSGNKYNNDTNASYGDTYTDDDIIGVALNLDDGELFFYKNGTIQNSGTAAYTSLSSNTYHPAVSDDSGSTACTWELNFGNAPFSISSGNSDANGHGDFEYSVPSGYFALCTKNLAESG
jgi:hypothetical protein|tara:strand:+ start:499 stop:1887 length:1389 start_codon:yes stop_codon:yes gene_type:complete